MKPVVPDHWNFCCKCGFSSGLSLSEVDYVLYAVIQRLREFVWRGLELGWDVYFVYFGTETLRRSMNSTCARAADALKLQH